MDLEDSHLKRDRMLYYSGLVLLLVGFPGLMLGSFLHDVAQVHLVGEAFDRWGWVNQTFALLGLVVGIVGCFLLGASLLGGVVTEPMESEHGGADQ